MKLIKAVLCVLTTFAVICVKCQNITELLCNNTNTCSVKSLHLADNITQYLSHILTLCVCVHVVCVPAPGLS